MTNIERIIDNLKQEKAELSKRIKKLIAKLDSRSLQFEDASLLENELGSIDDIDMSDFGFPPLETIEEENSEAHDDDFDEDPPEEPKSKIGQIYKLGRHRLMCGDSTKPEDVKTLMGGVQGRPFTYGPAI